MDRGREYRALWKMSLGQVTGSLLMVALGVFDVIIKCEMCSLAPFMPGFCLALAIWLPLFIVATALLTFAIGPEKGENHDKLVIVNIICSWLSILVCLVLAAWSVLNIMHTVELEMPTEMGYGTIIIPCCMIPLSLVISVFTMFSSCSAVRLIRVREERKIEPTEEDLPEVGRKPRHVPWWERMARSSVMSVHSSLLSRSMQSLQSELVYECEEHSAGWCPQCQQVNDAQQHGIDTRRGIQVKRSDEDTYGDEHLYESIDLSCLPAQFRQQSVEFSRQPKFEFPKPPRLPTRNKNKSMVTKPVLHVHKKQRRVGVRRVPSDPNRQKKLDELIVARPKAVRPISRVQPLPQVTPKRTVVSKAPAVPPRRIIPPVPPVRTLKPFKPTRSLKPPSPSEVNNNKTKIRVTRRQSTLSNSFTIVRIENVENVYYDV